MLQKTSVKSEVPVFKWKKQNKKEETRRGLDSDIITTRTT